MNKELDIAAILRDKPKGTRLWSPAFGDVELDEICDEICDDIYYCIHVVDTDSLFHGYNKEGKLSKNGECVLFPSKAMQDWSKLAWKKGDVLKSIVGNNCIFDCWSNEDYTEFYAEFLTTKGDERYAKHVPRYTIQWYKEDNKQYIHEIEKHYGGKLNLSTLEFEKPQFKDGDIVVLDKSKCFRKEIRLFKKILDEQTNIGEYHIGFEVDDNNKLKHPTVNFRASCNTIHLATEEEKQQLFDALAKEGMVWDAEKKAVVDLPKKCEFKPFDKVLSRMSSEYSWRLNIYSHKTKYYHICIDGSSNQYCVPYNEQTAHLLGTTDDWEGGEG